MSGQLQLTRPTTTLHQLKMDYSCYSIPFSAREFVFPSVKSKGVVGRNVMRHWFMANNTQRNVWAFSNVRAATYSQTTLHKFHLVIKSS
jgi:hypothetical protein